ncbi:hypothetical protein ABER98_01800 [Domibacillus aminovorans]|uniref:hypothetical protein n=1 Tax=Domibacillus aminovorans TaxID=29332 RepID=UPI003D20C14B
MQDFKSQLVTWARKNEVQDNLEKKSSITKKRRLESLSEQEVKELMGVGRPRYSRGRGGALRQK